MSAMARSLATSVLLALTVVAGVAQQATDTAPPLRIVPDPREAKVVLLNVEQGYEWGMPLKLGAYHVEISAPGYRTARQWLDHNGSQWYQIRLVPEGADLAEPALADVGEPDLRLAVQETSPPAELPQPILGDSIPLAWLQATAPGRVLKHLRTLAAGQNLLSLWVVTLGSRTLLAKSNGCPGIVGAPGGWRLEAVP